LTIHRLLIVFDLDGTLIDSVRDLAESASELAVTLGGRSLGVDEVAGMVGDGARVLVERALLAAGLSPELPGALDRFLDIYDRRLLNHTKSYSGMREGLALAARVATLAVLTNKPRHHSMRILDALELTGFFDDIVAGDGPYPRKPDPGALRALMARHGGVPTLLIGDSPIDAQTAAGAGCAFALARYGFGSYRFDRDEPSAAFTLDHPSDLAAVLDRFRDASSGS
jgi:phosphoglycolate phosphatase